MARGRTSFEKMEERYPLLTDEDAPSFLYTIARSENCSLEQKLFLLKVGDEVEQWEEDPELRQIARTFLVRHVLPVCKEDVLSWGWKSVESLINFFAAHIMHTQTSDAREKKELEAFLLRCWWMPKATAYTHHLITPALVNAKCFDSLIAVRAFSAIPLLFQDMHPHGTNDDPRLHTSENKWLLNGSGASELSRDDLLQIMLLCGVTMHERGMDSIERKKAHTLLCLVGEFIGRKKRDYVHLIA